MNDFTCKEFLELIDSFNLSDTNRENALKYAGLPKNIKNLPEELIDTPIIPNLKLPLLNYLHDFLSQNATIMEAKNLEKLLQRKSWLDTFHERNLIRIKNISGSHKNRIVMRIYNLHKEVSHLSFDKLENREIFKKFFSIATKIHVEVEEDSVIKVMHDLFLNKAQHDISFVKEIFAIYLENVATDPKYQYRVNEIKKWAETQSFSELFPKYKNIRTLFENSHHEELFIASAKKYDLSKIVKDKGLTLKYVKQNFEMLNSFIEDKIKGNNNLQNFVVIDEKICHKILFIYKDRDYIIDAVTQMHELFFNRINNNKGIQTDLMNEIWEKLMLQADLKTNLNTNHSKTKQAKI